MNQFIDTIFGTDIAHGYFAALLFFGFIGALVKLFLHSAKGTRSINNGTPTDWSAEFMFVDNWKRLVLGFLLMFLFVRFYAFALTYLQTAQPAIYAVVAVLPKEVVCVAFGFFIDYIVQQLKRKYPLLQVNRTPNN